MYLLRATSTVHQETTGTANWQAEIVLSTVKQP
jgi:hypothetical protein